MMNRERPGHHPLAIVGFLTLSVSLLFVAQYFGVKIGVWTAASVLLVLAPYWFFGFGFDQFLRRNLKHPIVLTLAPCLLIVPYLIFALPQGLFHWSMCLGMMAIILAIAILLQQANAAAPDWRDWLVLAILGVSVDLHFFDRAWPVSGLSGIPKLLFVDAGLYGYLVIRPIGNIGFDFRIRRPDLLVGLREFLYFAPIAIILGFTIGFLHIHHTLSNPLAFAAGWLFTFFFVAMPEELFFRGLMLNMLERRMSSKRALITTSLLFGLAHFNKRTTNFNWRYVIVAAVAGFFYGHAWLARRRLIASAITHATVDTVWSIWLR
jgi:uncharacterized protein